MEIAHIHLPSREKTIAVGFSKLCFRRLPRQASEGYIVLIFRQGKTKFFGVVWHLKCKSRKHYSPWIHSNIPPRYLAKLNSPLSWTNKEAAARALLESQIQKL